MKSGSSQAQNLLMNLALVVFGIFAAVLLYAFVIRWTGPDRAPLVRADGIEGDIIQVDVRNGCGVSGLAAEMTDFLRSRGFDVVDFGNHSNAEEEESYVLDRIGRPDAARALARAAGLPEDRVRTEIRDDYFLDATIVIGADYKTLAPFASNTP